MRLRRPLPAVQGDTLHIVGVGDNRIGKEGRSWKTIHPSDDNGEFKGSLYSVIQTDKGTFFAAGFEKQPNGYEFPALLRSTDGASWFPIRLDRGSDTTQGRLVTVMQTKKGAFVVAGFEHRGEEMEALLLVYSVDGVLWTLIRPEEDGKRLRGHLHSLLQAKNGTLLGAGFEYIDKGGEGAIVLRSTDGLSWTAGRPEEDGERLRGHIHSLLQAQDGTILGAGFEYIDKRGEGLLVLRSIDGLSWTAVRPEEDGERLLGQLYSLWQSSNGDFLALNFKPHPFSLLKGSKYSTAFPWLIPRYKRPLSILQRLTGLQFSVIPMQFSSDVLLLHSINGNSWTTREFYARGIGDRPRKITFLKDNPDTIVLTGSKGSWLKGTSKKEATIAIRSILMDLEIPSGIVLAGNVEQLLLIQKQNRERMKTINADLRQQENFVQTAEASLKRQAEARITFQNVAVTLDQALRKAEPVREAGQIATRIAIVGLLIYLVQILVNRYRYHQRLAKFYRARAQALRLLMSASTNEDIFNNTTFSDLATALSPDRIGSDKNTDPPTQEFLSNLRGTVTRQIK